jgi:hypothetical protein
MRNFIRRFKHDITGERFKDELMLAIKFVGIAIIGASSQALTLIQADMIWQVPLVTGFIYLCYSSLKQIFDFFQKVKNFKKL